MFIPGSTPTNTNLPITTMNNNLHQQFLFDNLSKYHFSCFFVYSYQITFFISSKTNKYKNFSNQDFSFIYMSD